MRMLEVFIGAALAGMGLTIGALIILGWVLLLRSWVIPARIVGISL